MTTLDQRERKVRQMLAARDHIRMKGLIEQKDFHQRSPSTLRVM
jgi:hypothetical protein